jgi:hypothetical protein
MSANGCARCGRNRPDSVSQSVDPSVATSLPGPPDGAWARLGDEDVCPACQTLDERREVAMRVVSMIEREIALRQDRGIPPDEFEPPLAGFAMDERADAESDATGARAPGEGSGSSGAGVRGRATGFPDTGAPDDGGGRRRPEPYGSSTAVPTPDDAGLQLRVAVTGAFLTGQPLAVAIDDYAELQARLGTRLTGLEWRTEGLLTQGGTYETAGGGGFTKAIPLVIARREGVDYLPWLTDALEQSRDLPARDAAEGFGHVLAAIPKRLVIDVYDLGVAVLTAWFDLPHAATAQLGVTAQAFKRLVSLQLDNGGPTPIAQVLQRIVSATTTDYAEAVAEVAADQLEAARWRSGGTGESEDEAPDLLEKEYGRLLWLHPVHLLTEAPPATTGVSGGTATSLATRPLRTRRAVVRELSPTFHKTIALEGGVFAAGIGASAVVADRQSDAEHVPVRLVGLHWAYYALHIGIDRNLLGVLDSGRWNAPSGLKKLESDAADVFADHQRVMAARSRLDSELSALGGDELAVWDKIAEVQRFDAVVKAVDHKLEMLKKLAERRVALATTARARHINNVLGLLTMLSLVSLTGGLIGVLLGAASVEDPWWLAVGFVVAAGALAVFLYRRTFREVDDAADPRRLTPHA